MLPRLPAVFCALALLVRAAPAGAHPEHMPEHFDIDLLVQRDGGRLELLVRTPLFLFQNVGLPLRGHATVDATALHTNDPHADGDATYAERAANAVAEAIALYAGGERVTLTAHDVQLAQHSNRAFDSYATARAHVTGEPPAADVQVDRNRGYLDVRFTGSAEAGAPLAFAPRIAPAIRDSTTFRVGVRGADGLRRMTVPGTGGRVGIAD